MRPPVGKSGPGTMPHQVVDRCTSGLRMRCDRGVDDLAEVVRRDVRRHADGDAARAVDEQVRELAPAGPSALARESSKFGAKSTVSLSMSARSSTAMRERRASV